MSTEAEELPQTANSDPVWQGPSPQESRLIQRKARRWKPLLIRPPIIMVPVRLGVPLMVPAVPPLMISVPAMFALRSQLVPTISRLGALSTVLGNRVIEPHFGLFNFHAAFVSLVSVGARRSGEK